MTMRLIVLTSPSGAGKTTLARRLMEEVDGLVFSVSATTREPREGEVPGRDYVFMNEDEFRNAILAGAFVEYEEVYPGLLYGTLRSEIDRAAEGGAVLLDIDVKGARNVKRIYGDDVLTIFIKPPEFEVLGERLKNRGSDSEEDIRKRLRRARMELEHVDQFDHVIVNDNLEEAVAHLVAVVRGFLAKREE